MSAVRIPAHAKYALDEAPFQLPRKLGMQDAGSSGHVIASHLAAAIERARNSAFPSGKRAAQGSSSEPPSGRQRDHRRGFQGVQKQLLYISVLF